MRSECGHGDLLPDVRCCEHLVGLADLANYHQRLTGVGATIELVCEACLEVGAPAAARICEACHELIVVDHGCVMGTTGTPGFPRAPEPVDATLRDVALPHLDGRLLDAVALEATDAWLLLDEAGGLWRHRPRDPTVRVGEIELLPEPDHVPWDGHGLRHRLHASRSGRFAAVVNDYGQLGAVVDLEAGAETMRLDGGDYRPDTVPFSFAFAEHRGRTVAIHRTAWNRLDVSDPETGALLTARGPTVYERDGPLPEHYLDYFHGRLQVSPDGRHIVDDGWIWAPVGVPTAWRVDRWLDESPFESEDGPSRRSAPGRDYYWNHGFCWIDARRVAVEGIGGDELAMIDGAVVYDVAAPSSGRRLEEVGRLLGPRGELFSDGSRLFASDEGGLRIFRIHSGALTAELGELRPTRQHRSARELAELRDDGLRIWSYGEDTRAQPALTSEDGEG